MKTVLNICEKSFPIYQIKLKESHFVGPDFPKMIRFPT